MKAIRFSEDEKRIYFQNLNRIPPREELAAVLKVLKDAGYKIDKPQDLCLAEVYACKKGDEQFEVLFTYEEAIIYSDEPRILDGLMGIFRE